MATLKINLSHHSNNLELLRSLGQAVDQLFGGDNDKSIRLHYTLDDKTTPPINGYSVYPQRGVTTQPVGRQAAEALLGRLERTLRRNPDITDLGDFTEGVLVVNQDNRWVVDYNQMLKSLNQYSDFTSEFYATLGEVLSNEKVQLKV